MIVWFDDLVLGMRYRGAEIKVTRDDIKRFAAVVAAARPAHQAFANSTMSFTSRIG